MGRSVGQSVGECRALARTVALGTWGRVAGGHFGLIAAGVAFYAMFAVFPGLTALIAIWSLWADPAAIAPYLTAAEEMLPAEAAQLVQDQVTGLVSAPRGALGWATALSVGVALMSARAGVSALIRAMDFVHGTGSRGLIRGFAVDLGLTLALVFTLLAALATAVAVPVALAWAQIGPAAGAVVSALPWAALTAMVMASLGILYRYGPNTERRSVTPGAVVAALVWAGVSIAFSAYLANFGSYNRIYGGIGAVIALLMWLYLSVWSVLLGAAVNAEWPQRRPGQT